MKTWVQKREKTTKAHKSLFHFWKIDFFSPEIDFSSIFVNFPAPRGPLGGLKSASGEKTEKFSSQKKMYFPMQPAKGARTISDRLPRGLGDPPGSPRGPPRDHFWKDFETILGSLLMSFFFKFLDEFWNVFRLRSSTFSINTDINTTASTSTHATTDTNPKGLWLGRPRTTW